VIVWSVSLNSFFTAY